ncbi:MAG: GGDEF domain-containing protein [Proteobacteria bacterium]|nr:GGDEF domain-containing protein [Pseudomonadota bacterium]
MRPDPDPALPSPSRPAVATGADPDYDGALEPVLEELFEVARVEGLAVLDTPIGQTEPRVLHHLGVGGPHSLAEGWSLLRANPLRPAHIVSADRRPIMACPWVLPPGRPGGLVLWRAAGEPTWQDTDHALVAGIGVLLRTLVATGVGQIGIDRLTGLPNRRWFIDEVDRHLDRLDLGGHGGTLSVIDVGNLGLVNATAGREAGNTVLIRLAAQLRMTVRPGDAVARIAGDQFAVWQPAMDHMTAAERADALCGMRLFPDLPPSCSITLSIGIISRQPDSIGGDDTRGLLRRAREMAAAVKETGTGGWRVAQTGSRPA